MKEIYQNSDEFSRLQDTPPVESDVFSPAGDTAPASEFYIPQGEDFAEIPPVTEKKKSEETSKSTLQKLVRRMGYLVAASVATVSLGSTVKLNVSTTPGGESDYATAYVCDAENRAALDANITIYDESGKNIGTVHSKGSALVRESWQATGQVPQNLFYGYWTCHNASWYRKFTATFKRSVVRKSF